MISFLRIREVFLTLFTASLVMILSYTATVEIWSYTDPKGSLLSGQALLEHGSLDLQPYKDQMVNFHWQLTRDGDELYYCYPVGTTIIHLPGIWIANLLGLDLADDAMEAELNRLFASISLGIIFLLTVTLFRRRCNYPTSLLLSLVITLGSSLFSTLGLALWNLNYAVVCALAVIVILDGDNVRTRPVAGWWIGILLFAGFIARPSFALFVLCVFGYLALYERKQLLRAASLSAVLLGGYLLFHYAMLGSILAASYQISSFVPGAHMLFNMLGMFVSPSRGILVFSPFFLLTLLGAIRYRRTFRSTPWLTFVTVWFAGLIFFFSGWFMWWGGGGFGNRLFTETMPGWVYLSAVFWPKLWKDDSRGWRWATWILIPLFAVFSTWIHVVQAGNNMWTVVWHQRPHKDQFPDYFWNVRFPQWLASEKQVVAMEAWHETVFMGVVIANIPVENLEAQPGRWGTLEGTYEYWRWSIGRSATIEWKGWPDSAYRPERISLGIDANVYLDQSIGVFVNDEQVGRINSRANEGRLLFRMDAFPVDPSVPLRIEFRMNNPKIPAVEHAGESADNRELGIQLFNVVIFSR